MAETTPKDARPPLESKTVGELIGYHEGKDAQDVSVFTSARWPDGRALIVVDAPATDKILKAINTPAGTVAAMQRRERGGAPDPEHPLAESPGGSYAPLDPESAYADLAPSEHKGLRLLASTVRELVGETGLHGLNVQTVRDGPDDVMVLVAKNNAAGFMQLLLTRANLGPEQIAAVQGANVPGMGEA